MEAEQLARLISDAARDAVKELYSAHPDDTFYYCALITTGEGHTPFLTAWSHEKLAELVTAQENSSVLTAELKWSYSDSPFCYFGEAHFQTVKQIFIARSETGDRDSTTDPDEIELRLKAMELAMSTLDREGLFGTGDARNKIVINAEVMPPDHTNVARAKALNPEQALIDWMKEAAEME